MSAHPLREESRSSRHDPHARAAEAIERHSLVEVAALAYHFAEAGTNPINAARYCRLAAAQAEQRFAYHEAARLWKQGITCLDQACDAPVRDRLELVLGMVGALAQAGELARARSYRQDAVRAALPLNELLRRQSKHATQEVVVMTNDVNYFEIGSPDPAASKVFYGTLFGWNVGEPSMPARYSMVNEDRGGLWDTSQMGAANCAIFYVQVEDVRTTAERAQELGAAVVVPLVDNGRIEFAQLTDPLGNRFGTWCPKPD